ncbi:hypothetical protein HU200_047159 [Digitaria exilis]|uniref:Uncharacterized protein n=1 Tax=Digitaria exilis TaxID=1010633 RepID=A0A835AYE4_9POAL|nr:hypothetical protein HU200_047159 [Digitaria exilis]
MRPLGLFTRCQGTSARFQIGAQRIAVNPASIDGFPWNASPIPLPLPASLASSAIQSGVGMIAAGESLQALAAVAGSDYPGRLWLAGQAAPPGRGPSFPPRPIVSPRRRRSLAPRAPRLFLRGHSTPPGADNGTMQSWSSLSLVASRPGPFRCPAAKRRRRDTGSQREKWKNKDRDRPRKGTEPRTAWTTYGSG